MQASADLRMAGRQLSGANKLPALLWVVNQAALADAAVGVAVWVRLLLPQLLGLIELPSSGPGSSKSARAAVAGGDQAQLLVPLDVPSQKTALQYLAGGCNAAVSLAPTHSPMWWGVERGGVGCGAQQESCAVAGSATAQQQVLPKTHALSTHPHMCLRLLCLLLSRLAVAAVQVC